MKKQKAPKLSFLIFLILLFLFVIPLIINYSFKLKTKINFFIIEWNAGDALTFYGSIIGSIISILGVFLSIKYAQQNYLQDTLNKVLPYLSLEILEKKLIDPFSESIYSKIYNTAKSESVKKQEYKEIKLKKMYFIIKDGIITVKVGLNKEQMKLAERGGNVWIPGEKGEKILTNIPTFNVPIKIENVGNGAAISIRIGFNKKNITTNEKKYVKPLNLKIGDSIYLNFFCTDIKKNDLGEYILEFMYEDIYKNKYIQSYNISIEKNSDDTDRNQFVIEIESNQKRIN